jgi:hypothetical protein
MRREKGNNVREGLGRRSFRVDWDVGWGGEMR